MLYSLRLTTYQHVPFASTSCAQRRAQHVPVLSTACAWSAPVFLQAALARTTQLDASIPTIAFLITDAEPHTGLTPTSYGGRYHAQQSYTAEHELSYLALKYPNLSSADARDFFKCFQETALAHFGSNLILNCVVYNTYGLYAPQLCEAQLLFASLAQQTGGMLMQPLDRNSSSMATGLLSVVKALMARLQGGQVNTTQHQHQPDEEDGALQGLQAFKLVDLSGVNPDRSSEQEPAGVVNYGDTQELFNIAMDRMVAGEALASFQTSGAESALTLLFAGRQHH